jgi:hypothetical protein
MLMMMVLTGCSEFAMLSSGSSLAISHNVYAKTYSGVDVITIIKTEKDIKTHAYEAIKEHR